MKLEIACLAFFNSAGAGLSKKPPRVRRARRRVGAGLTCLKRCGMSIEEMREYLQLCLKGEASIPERKSMLAGRTEYHSNLLAR